MNHEDEPYVRFYTRDTVSWCALPWEAQTVLALMLHGKFDRSGVFDCDGHTPSHAVTLVTRLPAAVVEVGLARLLETGTWVLRDGLVVWPKYVHAQTCRRNDRLRQKESRDNRRLDALGEPSPRVTSRHTGHPASHSVTLSRADTELSRAEISDSGSAPSAPPPKPKAKARWRKFPADFEPTDAHRALAAELGVDLAEQLALLRDHEFKDPKSDAAAVLRTWLRNSKRFGSQGPGVRRATRAPMQGDHGLTGFEGTHLGTPR